MPETDDARSDAPTSRFAQWLRALAREVERDPDLAARVTGEVAPTAASDTAPVIDATPPARPDPAESPPTAETVAPPAAEIAPVTPPAARHIRRSSRYGPPLIAGRSAELGAGVPDPFAVRAASGEEGLRAALLTLRVGTLRAIIRAHGLDPEGRLAPHASEKRLIAAIVAATRPPKPGATKRAAKVAPRRKGAT